MFRPLSHDSHHPNLGRNLTSRRHRQSYRCLKLLCRERRYQKVLAEGSLPDGLPRTLIVER